MISRRWINTQQDLPPLDLAVWIETDDGIRVARLDRGPGGWSATGWVILSNDDGTLITSGLHPLFSLAEGYRWWYEPILRLRPV